jgi:hypothetical protein
MQFYSTLAFGILGYLIWQIYRRFIARGPLDNIRGPISASFFAGNAIISRQIKLL